MSFSSSKTAPNNIDLDSAQTLTNKTVTDPVINGEITGTALDKLDSSATINLYKKGDGEQAQVGEFSQGSDPTFGNGGATSSSFAITSVNPARGTKAFEMTLNASAGLSNDDYVRSELIPVPLGYRGQFMTISVKYNYTGANDDIKFVVRDETNSLILTDSTEKFASYNSTLYKELKFLVYVSESCANLTVGPQVITHSTGGEVLKWDDVKITPDDVFYSDTSHITNWTQFTPTIEGMATISSHEMYWRRVGSNMEIQGFVISGGVVTDTMEMPLPEGVTIDHGPQEDAYGHVVALVNGVSYDGAVVAANFFGGNTYGDQGIAFYTASGETPTVWNGAAPNAWAGGSIIRFSRISVPIVGWDAFQENVLTKANVGDIGSIQAFGGTGTPDGFLYCNGQTVSRIEYADLFAAIGTAYGAGDGSTTFHLPDFRGNFLRGQSDGIGADPDAASRVASNAGGNTGDNVGSYQSYQIQSHQHGVDPYLRTGGGALSGNITPVTVYPTQTTATHFAGGNETRPVNVYVRYHIRYRHSVSVAALPKIYGGMVGEVKTSMMTEAQFQALAGTEWVLMDGRSVAGSAYAALIGSSNIPDARGRVLRMKDHSAGVNGGGELALGDNQGDATMVHMNADNGAGWGGAPQHSNGSFKVNHGGAVYTLADSGTYFAHRDAANAFSTTYGSANETRMKNTTINFFVKIN